MATECTKIIYEVDEEALKVAREFGAAAHAGSIDNAGDYAKGDLQEKKTKKKKEDGPASAARESDAKPKTPDGMGVVRRPCPGSIGSVMDEPGIWGSPIEPPGI